MTGGVSPGIPEGVLSEVAAALRSRRPDVRRLLLRSKEIRPGSEPAFTNHALTVVLDVPQESREEAEAAIADHEVLAELLRPLITLLEPNVGLRFPSTRALSALEDDNVVVYDREA